MIVFITNSKNHKVTPNDNLVIKDFISAKNELIDVLYKVSTSNKTRVSLDTETTGLDPYTKEILLLIIGIENTCEYVIDTTTSEGNLFARDILNIINSFNLLTIGSNLKFDYKMILVNLEIELKYTYDTELTERRLYQGLGVSKDNLQGYKFNLLDTLKRRFNTAPQAMDKDVRLEFVGAYLDTFVFYNYHIEYAAGDVSELFKLKDAQDVDIIKYNLAFLIYSIEQPLMPVLAKTELKGFKLDVEKWQQLYEENIIKAHEYALELDKELKRLVENSEDDVKRYFKGGKLYKNRQPPFKAETIGLFGEPLGNKEIFNIAKKKVNFNPNCFNYESPNQLVIIFGLLKEPYPTKNGTYEIPIIQGFTKVVNSYCDFSGIEGNFNSYINENPDSKMIPFIKLLIEYRFHSTRASNFGLNFIEKFMNPVTKRLHTALRQCNAITGRLQSGDTDNGYYNAQNIPADKAYRHCFIADEGYSIGTYDLSGAEAVIMGSKAQDTDLIRMAIIEDDIHSPLAQSTWRNIYLFRAGCKLNLWQDAKDFWKLKDVNFVKVQLEKSEYCKEEYELSLTTTINKKENKHLRNGFKPCTFGVVYGMYAKKASKALNVSVQEGQLVIDTIKLKIPKTIAMVESNSRFAVRNGYLILNTRTNSRVWFPEIIRSMKYAVPLDNKDRYSVESNARNFPIQGTQADMIKETMVEISNFITKKNFDVYLLKQVHDELVYMIPKHLDGHSEEFKSNPDNFNMDEYIKETMKKVANRYLTNIEMGVEGTVNPYWTK